MGIAAETVQVDVSAHFSLVFWVLLSLLCVVVVTIVLLPVVVLLIVIFILCPVFSIVGSLVFLI